MADELWSHWDKEIAADSRAGRLDHLLSAARAASDTLLTRILPAAVAEELKRRGEVEPLFFDSITVLFTDFVGFTRMAESMLPDDLVRELDGYFSQFDAIAQRNGLEKLKTIGDAYMCAGGVPGISPTHAIDCCLAALEIRSFVDRVTEMKLSAGSEFCKIRIGIHSGPVTAGVIGTNKFAYDIWGDTVNTASRLEASGVPSRVNISGATHELVRNFFACEYRGEVEAKGKGMMAMYFLDRIHPDLCDDSDGLVPNQEFRERRARLHGSGNGRENSRVAFS